VHWYFPTKDDLFAAVLERVFGEAIAEVEASDPAPRDRLEALLSKTQKYRVLRREAYERIEESEALRAVYSGLLQ
jgi:AcrR family transcriptional regulator